MRLKIGQEAPGFTLLGTLDGEVTLSSYLGEKNVVLVFYGIDGTPN